MTSGAPSAQSSALFSTPRKLSTLCCLLLAAVTLALYNPVAHFDFVNFDDDRYITANAHVKSGLSADTVRWAFTSTEQANWHPLTWLSHAADCQIFRLNASGPHLINVFLHALNAIVLFLLLQRATGKSGRSFFVAALFALHPLNVETVAWVSERKSLLSTLLFLLAIAAYGAYVHRRSWLRYLGVFIAFALALMAKPAVITLPFCLLVLDYWPLRRFGAGADEAARRPFFTLVIEKVPLFVLSAASAVITLYAQRAGGAVKSFVDYPLSSRLGNAVLSYALYLEKATWPARLAAFYPFPARIPWWEVFGSAVFVVGITAVVLRRGSPRYLAAGWFWYLGTLVPMIGLMQVGGQAMADRYSYIPLLGVAVMIVWSIADRLGKRQSSSTFVAAAAGIVLMVLAFVARAQIATWHDSLALWSHALAVTNNNFVAEDNLGNALVADGRYDEAVLHFRRAAEINPKDPLSQLNLGAYSQQHGDTQAALAHNDQVLQLTGDPILRANALANAGSAYRAQGDYEKARASYNEALKLNPNDASALVGLGIVEYKTGNFARASNAYYRAMLIQPTDVGYLLTARALEHLNQRQAADAARAQAEKLTTNLAQAQDAADRLLSQ